MKQNLIGYFRGEPTHHQRMTANGRITASGKGLAGLYLPFRTSIEAIAMTSLDQPFSFREITCDSQEVTLQGAFIYRVIDPNNALDNYNFVMDPTNGNYRGDGPQKMPESVLEIIRAETRGFVQAKQLEVLLTASTELSSEVINRIKDASTLTSRGLKVDVVYFSSITPKKEIAAGLEATYREKLLARADEASYARRAAAVEKERAIKTNQMDTDILIEEERKKLIALQAQNIESEAQAKANALGLELKAFENIDAETIRAHALYLLGRNASNIGTLTITPEVLAGLAGRS